MTHNRHRRRPFAISVLACTFALAAAPGSAMAGEVTEVAPPSVGSSEPTYFGTQHRIVVAEGGRALTVHGLHGQGVKLAWRDPGGEWQNDTTGAAPDGVLLNGTGTGDWPASIAVARDSEGEEHAWAVFARISASHPYPLYMRRISDLDSESGPTVGPLVELDSPELGAYKADVAFEEGPNGEMRGAVLWSRWLGETNRETVLGWLTDLDTDTPTLEGEKVIIPPGPAGNRWGTLVSSGTAMNALVRPGVPGLKLFRHPAESGLDAWEGEATGLSTDTAGYPSAAVLDSGQVLSVVGTNAGAGEVKVQRFAANGTPREPELTLNGYSSPTIATDGTRAWIVMIRNSDGLVVSRSYVPGIGWSVEDELEVGAEAGGGYDYPNLVRTIEDGTLRFVFEGTGSGPVQSKVLAYERTLPTPEPMADLSLSISDKTDPIRSGRKLTYVVKVRNRGPDAADGVEVVGKTPGRIVTISSECGEPLRPRRYACSLGAIDAGTKKKVKVRIKTGGKRRRVEHTASATAATDDPDLANNAALERTLITR